MGSWDLRVTGFLSAEWRNNQSPNLSSSILCVTLTNRKGEGWGVGFIPSHSKDCLGIKEVKESPLQGHIQKSLPQVSTFLPHTFYLIHPSSEPSTQFILAEFITTHKQTKNQNFIKYPNPLRIIKISLRLTVPIKFWLNDLYFNYKNSDPIWNDYYASGTTFDVFST